MVETETAQRGILQAILSLHSDGTFTALLEDFYKSVLPKYFALDLPTEPVFNEPPEPATIGTYTRYSRARHQRRADYEDALQEWARRFLLTHDLTTTGECLPWILDFGRRSCEHGSFTIAPPHRVGRKMPPPWGWLIDAPNSKKENWSEWVARIRPELRKWYCYTREQQRSRSYPDPAKRNPEHFKWFVLSVCAGMGPGKIAETLEMPAADESTLRKGIMSVRGALGVRRK